MQKFLKVFTAVLIIAAVAISVMAVPVSAASTIISFSKNNVKVGDTVSVTVTVSENSMYGAKLNISYNESVLTYVSGASGGAGELQIVDESLSGENRKSYTITFKAKKAGNSVISASGSVGAGIPATDVNLKGASATMTVKDVTLSSNANLSSLSVSVGSLSPRFAQSKTSYTVNVKKSVTVCKVYATTVDSGATVEVTGSPNLKVGANVRKLIVTAPSGAQKTYTITINRSDVDEVEESDISSTSSETAEESTALETVIEGVTYKVLKNISKVNIPSGFDVTKKVYNNIDVQVATDETKTYEFYYLQASGGKVAVPYVYDEINNAFEKVYVIAQGDNAYVVADLPEDYIVPESYYRTSTKINGMEIKCHASTKAEFTDMYYLYCFFDGKYGMYRYDDVEKVLQRSPEFKLYMSDEEQAAADLTENNGFGERFNSLSVNAKTIVVGLAIVLVGIVVLIILLVIKFTAPKQMSGEDSEFTEDEFDNIKFNANFEIISGEETEIKDEDIDE